MVEHNLELCMQVGRSDEEFNGQLDVIESLIKVIKLVIGKGVMWE